MAVINDNDMPMILGAKLKNFLFGVLVFSFAFAIYQAYNAFTVVALVIHIIQGLITVVGLFATMNLNVRILKVFDISNAVVALASIGFSLYYGNSSLFNDRASNAYYDELNSNGTLDYSEDEFMNSLRAIYFTLLGIYAVLQGAVLYLVYRLHSYLNGATTTPMVDATDDDSFLAKEETQ